MRTRTSRKTLLHFVVVLLCCFLDAAGAFTLSNASACSVCIGGSDGQRMNAGFYWSALLLTVLPFAIVGAVGAWLGWTVRRAHRHGLPTPRPTRFP